MVTLVTSLYDLEFPLYSLTRGRFAIKSPKQMPLLRLNAKMVIYAPIELQAEIPSKPEYRVLSLPIGTPTNKDQKRSYLLSLIAQENPYSSEYLFWIDPDYLILEGSFPLEQSWPDANKTPRLGQRMMATLNKEGEVTAFGGPVKAILNISPVQQLLEMPNILYSLASNTPLNIPYPFCLSLRVFSACSKEIKTEDLRYFIESCRHLGYQYTLLGREESWGGWSWRTKTYLKALRECKEEVSIVCDCTDLFFLGPSTEMYERFKDNSSKVFVSAEENEAYPGGKYSKEVIQSFFLQRLSQRRGYAYSPNGGFLIGYTQDLIKVLERNQEAKDDQTGYCEMFYEGRQGDLEIDSQSLFCANFPNIPSSLLLRERWSLDHPRFRLSHRPSGIAPLAVHFPGQNYKVMDYIYSMSEMGGGLQDTPSNGSSANNTCGIWTWILVGILVVIVIIGIILAV